MACTAAENNRRVTGADGSGRPFVIYVHTNLINGKKYVGMTEKTMMERWAVHIKDSRSRIGKKSYCRYFHSAIRKYGEDAFAHEVLEVVVGKDVADEAERHWIAQLNCRAPHGYNIAAGGSRGPMHEDSRARIAAASRARMMAMPPEDRKEMARKGGAARSSQCTSEEFGTVMRAMHAARTPEQRSESARRSNATRLANSTHEERSAYVLAGWALRSPEARDAHAKAVSAGRMSKMTAEQRSGAAVRMWEKRRARLAALSPDEAEAAAERRRESARKASAASHANRRTRMARKDQAA